MNKKIVVIVTSIILFAVLLHLDLGARITGKIEGRVVDDETGSPIVDVFVELYIFMERQSFVTQEVRTDSGGNFVFSGLNPRKYFIGFKKEGYVGFPRQSDIYKSSDPTQVLQIIDLPEGERRFVNVRLKRGALIKGKVLLKDTEGIRPIPISDNSFDIKPIVRLYRELKPTEKSLYYTGSRVEYAISIPDSEGNYFLDGVEPGYLYELLFFHKGFANHSETIEVSNIEPIEIDHTFDETDETFLSVKVFVNNTPARGRLSLIELSTSLFLGNLIKENDRYILKNLKPGSYRLKISIRIPNNERIRETIPIEIERGKTKYLELKY